jgi:hypothetical protein
VRWRNIIITIGSIIVIVGIGVGIGWPMLRSAMVAYYYKSTYQARSLTAADIQPAPAASTLQDMPWIAADLPVCQSTSLQMIAAQHGNHQPRPAIDLLMAFTYGFTAIPDSDELIPFGQDPEIGMLVAAPYLGLERQYYVTDDADLWIAAAQSFLARGYPVRVALDMGRLYDQSTFIGHSEVLVGYDQQGFFVYETVCIPPAPCQPGQYPAGASGLYRTHAQLLAAMESQAAVFSYPWRYNLTVFTPVAPTNDLRPIWQQLARVMLGADQYGLTSGVVALERLIEKIEQKRVHAAQLGELFATTARFRHDNAAFLRERFAADTTLVQAAAYLEEAATFYDQVASDPQSGSVTDLLRRAAAAERAFGETIQTYAR